MSKGYVSEGSNCYQHLHIDKIYPMEHCTFLHCLGVTYRRDLKSACGYKLTDYRLKVKVLGYLVDFVNFELSEGDDIFVVGYFDNGLRLTDSIPIKYPVLVAECIYKEDWLKYFPNKELGEK